MICKQEISKQINRLLIQYQLWFAFLDIPMVIFELSIIFFWGGGGGGFNSSSVEPILLVEC